MGQKGEGKDERSTAMGSKVTANIVIDFAGLILKLSVDEAKGPRLWDQRSTVMGHPFNMKPTNKCCNL
jgi:hypothetical protein